MRFFTSSLFALAALATSVLGAENPIIYPDSTHPMTAGKPFTITWTPTTKDTITLTLRQGPSDNLDDVLIIVGNYANTGTFTWTPSEDTPAGDNYAIMITDKSGNVNYTPLITINSETPSKAPSSSAKPASTTKAASSKTVEASSTKTTESSTITPSPTITTIVHGNSTTLVTSMVGTGSSNATVTGTYGNTTRTSIHSSKPTAEESTSPSATAISTGAAAGLLKSPLALVVCLIGAVVYLN